MKSIRRGMLICAAAASAAFAAPSAQAGTVVEFPMTTAGTSGSSSAGRYYSVTVGSTTVKVRVSAWSTSGTNSGSSVVKGGVNAWNPNGLGASTTGESSSSPHHTIDNLGNKDFLILQFDQFVELESATFTTFNMNSGKNSRYDGDATIAHGITGANWMTDPLANSTNYAQLSALFGGSFENSNVNSKTFSTTVERDLNGANNVGNIWLIGAAFTNPVEDCGKKSDILCYDGFKLSALTFQTAQAPVPEPATWMMMILGFGFIGGALRRRNKAVAAAA